MKYLVRRGFPQDHYGNCSECGKSAHKARMTAGERMGEPAIFCRDCISKFKRWISDQEVSDNSAWIERPVHEMLREDNR